ncbi:SDR family oxidoreductase [Paenibacillus caui]|uniref:SDR family oxidoreductase n=1 Tax=Paenibacillus caui TaxID=2873927 RepID=UPI001F23B89C|nr:SDR family oxidoreductase [Paenibacillus caui]
MANIFITGGTGFIGKNILKQLSPENHSLMVLVRSRTRFDQIIKQMGLENVQTLTAVLGDLTETSLGLNHSDLERVLTADIIIHAGGPMDILLKEDQARQVFLQASDQILSLANHIHEKKGLKHFVHIVGYNSPFNEENMNSPERITALLDPIPPYERMKFLSDLRIRQGAKRSGFPLSVINPSVVIGDSNTGNTEQTGGLGILIDSTRRNLMRIVPGGKKYWLPLVHVDHVAAFVSALTKEENPKSQTYFLLDEQHQSPNMHELITTISKELRVKKPT